MRLLLLLAVLVVCRVALSADGECVAVVTKPEGWTYDGVAYRSHTEPVSLSVECSTLPRPLTDTEFAAHIGEEEPEEAPPLRKFGAFRGRLWVTSPQQLEWWLMQDRYLVHLTLRGDSEGLSEDAKRKVNRIARTLVVRRP
jgi:hypothetical protein